MQARAEDEGDGGADVVFSFQKPGIAEEVLRKEHLGLYAVQHDVQRTSPGKGIDSRAKRAREVSALVCSELVRAGEMNCPEMNDIQQNSRRALAAPSEGCFPKILDIQKETEL